MPATDDDLTPGQRLRTLRESTGKSREMLAGLIGYSAETVKKVETGKRELTMAMAIKAARALGVHNLSSLYGPAFEYTLTDHGQHAAVPAVRRALTLSRLDDSGRVHNLDYLTAALDSAWQTWHTSPRQRTEIGGILPDLITNTRRAVAMADSQHARAAHKLLSEVYHLAQAFLAWHGDRELVWMSADRGIAEAQAADDPLAITRAVWYWAHLLRAGGQFADTVIELDRTVPLITPLVEESHDAAAMLVDIHMCAALTLARAGDESAFSRWEEGRRAAETLLPPGYVHPYTRIGRVLTDVYAVMLAVDLGASADAHRLARELDPATIPSTERRARHLLELARGYHQSGDQLAVVYSLGQAVDISQETIAYSPAARALVRELLRHSPAAARDDVKRIAAKIGYETPGGRASVLGDGGD